MRQAFADFGTSLNRIRALANNINANTGPALANPLVRELHETQQCGAIVLLTGYFEAFLKDLVRQFIDDLSRTGLEFSRLPTAIQNRHFEGGGRVLTRASEAARNRQVTPFGNATREDIVARLHSTSAAAGSYQIVWEAFADTKANPNPNVVSEIAKNLGMNDFWGTATFRSGNSGPWSNTALKSKLNDLITMRNECAHTGQVSPIPTAADVLDFADMLEALGESFVSALESQISVHSSNVPPP